MSSYVTRDCRIELLRALQPLHGYSHTHTQPPRDRHTQRPADTPAPIYPGTMSSSSSSSATDRPTQVTICPRDIAQQLATPAPPRAQVDYSNAANLAGLQKQEQDKRLSEVYAAFTGNYTITFMKDPNKWVDLVACPDSPLCTAACASSSSSSIIPPFHRQADLLDLLPNTPIKITWNDLVV